MLDWRRLDGFEWDAGNARKSQRKHAVSQAEVEQIFFNDPLLVVDDPAHSAAEQRLHALGKTDTGRFLHATFTVRREGTRLRVISVRDMSRKERKRYEQEAKADPQV